MATITPIVDITEHGLPIFYMTDTATGQLKAVTAVTITPTFKRNGTPVAATGPFWTDTSTAHYGCFVAFRLVVDPQPGDVITWSAPPGWAVCGALPVPGATDGAISNFVGQSEPGRGNFNGVPVSPWNATPRVKLGFVTGSLVNGDPISFWNNQMHCLTTGVAGIATSDPATGRPLTINGRLSFSPACPGGTGAADSMGLPALMGEVNFIVDETAPSTPMVVSLTVPVAKATVTGPTITPGVIVGGVEVGKRWTWNTAYLPNPPSFQMAFNFLIATPNGKLGPYTLRNEQLLMPGSTLSATTPFAINPIVADKMITPSGTTPEFFRWGQTTDFYDSYSNSVHPADDFQSNYWGAKVSRFDTATIVSVRSYDLAVSPDVWFEQAFPHVVAAGGGPAPYKLSPPRRDYYGFGGTTTTNFFVAEIVLAAPGAPDRFKLGQQFVTLSGTNLNGLPCTDGDQPPVAVNLNGEQGYWWPTSATTGVVFQSRNFTNSNGQPDSINSIIGNNPVSGCTVTNQTPYGFGSIEACIQFTADLPNSGFWTCTPPGAAVDHVTAQITKMIAGLPPGRKVVHEVSNEVWSFIPPQGFYRAMGHMGVFGAPGEDFLNAYVKACKWQWDIGDALFAAAGRSADYIHVLPTQLAGPNITQSYMNRINAYNTANPGAPIRIDAVAPAFYVGSPTDSTMVAACAQCYSTDPRSTQFNAANPMTIPQWCDLLAHWTRYNTLLNGTVSPGWIGQTLAAIKTYRPVAGQPVGFVPPMKGYEGGFQMAIPYGNLVSTDDKMRQQLIHDIWFNPVYAKLVLANFLIAQDGGADSFCWTGMWSWRCSFGDNTWNNYTCPGQLPGPGLNNHYWIDDHFGHDGPANGFPPNESVAGYAFRAWQDVANLVGPPPPPLVPTVSSLFPISGISAGGTSVVINGTNFTGATAVKFGATPATVFVVNSGTQITATSPAGTGTVDVTVTTPAGTSATSPSDQFTYVVIIPPPVVTSLIPTSGPEAGGTSVTILGSALTGATSVKFGLTPSASFVVINSGQITAVSPAGTGVVDITVVTPQGTSTTGPGDLFTYVFVPPALVVTGISPTSGSEAGGTSVVISGVGFNSATVVAFGVTPATAFAINSDIRIVAVSPAGTGVVHVTVTTPTGTSSVSAADQFSYVPLPVGGTDLGRYRQGDTVEVQYIIPRTPPMATVSNSEGHQLSATLLWPQVPLIFTLDIFLDADYPPGTYYVEIGGVCGNQLNYQFTVVAGGDTAGPLISMHHTKSVHGQQVIVQSQSGDVLLGRNPRLE